MGKAPASELEFLEAIGAMSHRLRKGWVGPGDDAAVIPAHEGSLAFAADLLVEDIHFRLSTSRPEDVGYKALAVNVSDMAAMGARPIAAVVTLTVPESAPTEWFAALYAGMGEAEREFGCPVLGGDLSRGKNIAISVSILGECSRRGPIYRSGAKPGHGVYLTGSTGESGAGLLLLEKGLAVHSPAEKACVARHARPIPRLAFGREAARRGLASSMIDVSDGIARDALNLSLQSKAALTVEARLLPISPELSEVCAAHGLDALRLALSGGEDYELLLTADDEHAEDLFDLGTAVGLRLTRIGTVAEGEGARILGVDGKPLDSSPSGFDHFKGK